MRLGYLVPEFPGQTHIFFWREIEALRRVGVEVFLVSTKRPSAGATTHKFAQAAAAQTKYLIPPSLSSLFRWIVGGASGLKSGFEYIRHISDRSLTSQVRQLVLLASAVDLVRWSKRECIDHIHGHSCANSAHILALSFRMGGPSYSLTLHGDLNVYGGDHLLKSQLATAIFAVGGHLRRQLCDIGVPNQKIIETFMGVDTGRLSQLAPNRLYHHDELLLATVARLDRSKGHLHVLAAMARARELGVKVRYRIAGEGSFRETIRAKINTLGLGECVELCGTVSEEEVCSLLSQADVFVLASTGEGEAWPVSVMEAMSAGLPVVCSQIGATPQMITSGLDGILVAQRDEDAIFEAICKLAKNPEMRQRMGTAARKTAVARFDVTVSSRILLENIRGPSHRSGC